MIKTVTIFSGSSYPKVEGTFKDLAIAETKAVAHILGTKAQLVRNGGGLYGHLEDVINGVGKANGKIECIISDAFFKEDEVYPEHVTVIRTKDDVERQRHFLTSDAFVVTPGGDGTICESMLSHNDNIARLFQNAALKPVIWVNVSGYFNDLSAQFARAKEVGYSNNARQAQAHFVPNAQAMKEILWPEAKP